MTKKPTRAKTAKEKELSLNDLTREFLSADQIAAYGDELESASARTCVLVGGAAVDQLLLWLLVANFAPAMHSRTKMNSIFYDANAALGTFSSRTAISFAFGLITAEQRKDLDIIRRVRNAFAHRVQILSFDHPLVAAECRLLRRFNRNREPNSKQKDPRLLFINSINKLYFELIIAANKATRIDALRHLVTQYKPPSQKLEA